MTKLLLYVLYFLIIVMALYVMPEGKATHRIGAAVLIFIAAKILDHITSLP
jgi:hypothetical protein